MKHYSLFTSLYDKHGLVVTSRVDYLVSMAEAFRLSKTESQNLHLKYLEDEKADKWPITRIDFSIVETE